MKKSLFFIFSAVFIPMILLSNNALAVTPQCRAEIIQAANQLSDIGFKFALDDHKTFLHFVAKNTLTSTSGGQAPMTCVGSCTDGELTWLKPGEKGVISCMTAGLDYGF